MNCECVEEVEGELHFPPPDWKRPLLPLLLLLPRKCDVDEGVWLGGDLVTTVVVVVVVVVAAVPIVGV